MANNFRIGFGYDIHSFTGGDNIIVGGVKIPYSKGVIAHSDGDVLIHAICDALLGSAALGDIGTHFPDNDNRYKNISSLVLLEKTIEVLSNAGYVPVNIDCTLVSESPKISPHYSEIRKNIAVKCGLDPDFISVKATTNEKIGTIGRGEGMAAMAVALVIKKDAQSFV
jgi:2-C-methyl-D-erythritol 2,4-cyclodiphosphate synthase